MDLSEHLINIWAALPVTNGKFISQKKNSSRNNVRETFASEFNRAKPAKNRLHNPSIIAVVYIRFINDVCIDRVSYFFYN